MAKDSVKESSGESELWGAIAAFERILEVMPNDRLALETLADAYSRLGDISKASRFLLRLVDIAVNENDLPAATGLIDKIKVLGNIPEFSQARTRLESLISNTQPPAAAAPVAKVAAPSLRKGPDITREMSLAWDLMQAGELTAEEYSAVVHDLSENSSKNLDVPVSVLHALTDRQFKSFDKALAHLAKASGIPVISLTNFEILKQTASLLPLDVMSRRGAIPFEVMNKDLLVAVLNPMDRELQEDVRRLSGRRCHFYLTSATEYDAVLANIRKLLGADKGEAKA